MICLVLERVPAGLRGELTKWLLELRPGVFVGHLSPIVRDELWDLVRSKSKSTSSAVLILDAQTDQGLKFRVSGDPTRDVVDFEGLFLMRRRLGPSSAV